MAKRVISLLIVMVMLSSTFCLPTYAEVNTLKITDIANLTYKNNLNKLSLIEQQSMKNMIWKVQSRMPEDPVGYLSMSYMAMVTGGTNNKAQAVMAAWCVQKDPKSLCLVNNLGYALFTQKDYENSVKVFKLALEIDAKSLETIINLGNVYLDMNKDEDAKKTYESALKIDKDYYKAWEGLFGYYMKKKDMKKAMDIIAKIKPAGFIMSGKDEVQAELDSVSNAAKLVNITDSDSLDVMAQKIDKISKTKPLNVAPIVEEIDPAMAQKIKAEMEKLKVTIHAPDNPWPVDFSSAKDYYITSQGFGSIPLMSKESMTPQIDPAILEKGKQIQGLSDSEIDSMVGDYLKDVNEIMGKMQGLDMNDYSQLAEAMKGMKGISELDPFALKPSAADGKQVPGQSKPPSTGEQLGTMEKKGIVSSSNYNNYLSHTMNFKKYFRKITSDFEKKKSEIKLKFDKEMDEVKKRQDELAASYSKNGIEITEAMLTGWRRERNNVRDSYVMEFGNYLTVFYRRYVMTAIEKVENTQALYIKNMANKKLKSAQAEQMRIEVNSFLRYFAEVKAPIDGYEAESTDVSKAIEEQIKRVKASAPKNGEALSKLKDFEKDQKSLLEKLYEDTKYESSFGAVKITYENAELTLGVNDLYHNKYMDLGVNLKDFSASLTEGEGCEVGFSVAAGTKGISEVEVSADIGWSGRQPGKKTTIYFDDNFKAADAKITQTPGTQGLSTSVDVAGASLEGGVKIESTAEGTSKFVSSVKASYEDLALWEKQYQEEMKP